MKNIIQRLESRSWDNLLKDLRQNGYVLATNILTKEECKDLIEAYNDDNFYRKTINMERYRFGKGEYKYFDYPLPQLVTNIREYVYAKIVPVANTWMNALNINANFPLKHSEMKKLCHDHGQSKPTVLILKYGKGGFNTLHQDLYGEIYFPIQLVLFLNEEGEDYTGGEFVLTEQIPRAQSKANVLRPKRGDMLLFTTNFRPVKGTRGYYRVNMKHGVSPLHSGKRHTLGIIFHDAKS
ncbi:MAG TPA: 2OG-Fe(II) oxygenase [Cytophagales bacterium]|nr:2OG-Fe(II) oxygenase [Cytophagales bacterium]